MKCYGWCLLLLLAATGLPAHAESDFLPAEALHEASLVKFWQTRLPLEADQQLRELHLVDDQLYAGTDDGYVFAVHAYTGVLRWLQPVTRSGYQVRRPCHTDENVIFVTPVDTQSYDRRTGTPVLRNNIRFPAGTAAVCDGVRVFVGGIDARLHAITAESLWTDWELTTGGPISSTPAIAGDLVFAADERGNVYACSRAKKAFQWQSAVFGAVSADLVADDNGVYVACRDQSLYVFDLSFGRVRWRARFASPLYEPPCVSNELVFQYSESEGLVAVETGLPQDVVERLRWKLPEGRLALTTDARHVFALSDNEQLLAVRLADGKVTQTIPAAGFTMGTWVRDGGTIYLASRDGRLFCARPLGVPPLKAEDLLAALRPPIRESGPVGSAAATQPAAASAEEAPDILRSLSRSVPSGGKSKVTREFKGQDRGE